MKEQASQRAAVAEQASTRFVAGEQVEIQASAGTRDALPDEQSAAPAALQAGLAGSQALLEERGVPPVAWVERQEQAGLQVAVEPRQVG